MPRFKEIIISWLPAFMWMGLIYWLSSFHKLQATDVPWVNFITRKAAHMAEYTVLAVLFFRGIKNTTNFSLTKSLWLAFIFTVMYALTDEVHQRFVSGRTGKFYDVSIDAFGALIGVLVAKGHQIRTMIDISNKKIEKE